MYQETRASEPQPAEAARLVETLGNRERASLDRIVAQCVNEFDCSAALVSVLTSSTQHFVARAGTNLTSTPRHISFCQQAIADGEPIVVDDAPMDYRFFDNPLVWNSPYIRSYMAYPVRGSSGRIIGTLCLIDRRKYRFSPVQLADLERHADAVEDIIKLNESRLEISRLRRLIRARSQRQDSVRRSPQ